MPPTHDTHEEMLRLMRENQALLTDINARVKALERNARWAMILRIIGLVVFVVLPLVGLYFLFSFVASTLAPVTAVVDGSSLELSGTLQILELLQGFLGQ